MRDLTERGLAGPMDVIAARLIGAAERTVSSAVRWCAWRTGPRASATVPGPAQAQVPVHLGLSGATSWNCSSTTMFTMRITQARARSSVPAPMRDCTYC